MTHWTIANCNYENDSRVIASRAKSWFKSVDGNRMLATVGLRWWDDEDTERERDVEIPFKWCVCPTCRGNGSHVNPSVDCNGLTAEDFAEDPDFMEDYFNGRYDVTCVECSGDRVVPEISRDGVDKDVAKLIDEVQKQMDDDAHYEAISRDERLAEMRMGA